jgi:hypothetical protein
MVDDLYLIGYGFVRGFLSGILARFGIMVSDMTLDFLAIILGYYLKARPGWQGAIGRILYIGGLVSIGLEIGQSTGVRVANELFQALPLQLGSGGGARATSLAYPAMIRQPVGVVF